MASRKAYRLWRGSRRSRPEIEGEVVPRPCGDADEGKTVLDRDGGDQGLRAVTARHAQAVGTPGDGVSGELGQVEPVVEHDGLDPEGRGQLHQTELLDLAATRPWIAQQDRVRGSCGAVHSSGGRASEAGGQCRPGRQNGNGEESEADKCSDEGLPVFVPGQEQRADQNGGSQDRPDDAKPAVRGAFRDRPPSSGHAEGQADRPHRHVDAVANEEEDQCDNEQGDCGQRQGGESSRWAQGRSTRVTHFVSPSSHTGARHGPLVSWRREDVGSSDVARVWTSTRTLRWSST